MYRPLSLMHSPVLAPLTPGALAFLGADEVCIAGEAVSLRPAVDSFIDDRSGGGSVGGKVRKTDQGYHDQWSDLYADALDGDLDSYDRFVTSALQDRARFSQELISLVRTGNSWSLLRFYAKIPDVALPTLNAVIQEAAQNWHMRQQLYESDTSAWMQGDGISNASWSIAATLYGAWELADFSPLFELAESEMLSLCIIQKAAGCHNKEAAQVYHHSIALRRVAAEPVAEESPKKV